MASTPKPHIEMPSKPLDPFRRAVLRGLGVLLPPLLTVVIFVWVGNTVMRYVLTPLEGVTRELLVDYAFTVLPEDEFLSPPEEVGGVVALSDDEIFRRTPDGNFVSNRVYEGVEKTLATGEPSPDTARGYVVLYVNETFLQPWIVAPIFLSVFLLLLYTFGKFLAAGIGRFFWGQIESLINRVPLVSNVYSSVKQVTDFLFTDPDLDITRVVAVEYPRKGIWTVAFVTGESMLDIESAANEPVMSVLIPTSPMPFTGFTITVKKSETVDLNLTIDQAFQFIVSCGVVVPPQQLTRELAKAKQQSLPSSSPGVNGAASTNGSAGATHSTETAGPKAQDEQ